MNAIAAVSSAWGIGKDNKLLFRIPEDMRHFRALTTGGIIIMGRKTLQSMPGGNPLPNRRSIVLSHSQSLMPAGVKVAHSIEEVLRMVEHEDPGKVWVCGGGEIYSALLPYCQLCHITKVHANPPCDTFFPNLDEMPEWELMRREHSSSDGLLAYQFTAYRNQHPKM